jgi:Tol biopolymer transport system component
MVRTTPAPSSAASLAAAPKPSAVAPTPTATALPLVGEILYSLSAGDGHSIQVVDLDGTNSHPLLPGTSFDVARWSPDGTHVALSAAHGNRIIPVIVGADGSGYRELRPDRTLDCGSPVWTPDGRQLALECWDGSVTGRDGIYLLGVNGTGLHRLTRSHGIPGGFSPDGRRLVYTTDPGNELHVIYSDGNGDRRLALNVGGFPGWLPDGKTIFASRDGGLLLLADDGSVRRPIATPGGNAVEPRLSPDGKQLVFAFDVDDPDACCMSIARINLDGTGFTEIVPMGPAEQSAPDWGTLSP